MLLLHGQCKRAFRHKVFFVIGRELTKRPMAICLASPSRLKLAEFLPDTQQIGEGVVVNQPGWETVLEQNKVAFMLAFVQRLRFTNAYPTSLKGTAVC
jgi:hypothetical protein